MCKENQRKTPWQPHCDVSGEEGVLVCHHRSFSDGGRKTSQPSLPPEHLHRIRYTLLSARNLATQGCQGVYYHVEGGRVVHITAFVIAYSDGHRMEHL